MRIAIYVRVSTQRQAQTQTIDQQLERLRSVVADRRWQLQEDHIFRDDGYSGASLRRPGLDKLRDLAALARLDRILISEPDRLARNYVHQVLLMEELQRHGCRVEFTDRTLSDDPQDRLLLQIRGAVAEYERTLIAERTRRGRLHKLQGGQMLPWTRPPYGYRADPDHPRSRRRPHRPDRGRVGRRSVPLVCRRGAFVHGRGAAPPRSGRQLAQWPGILGHGDHPGHPVEPDLHGHDLRQPHPRACGPSPTLVHPRPRAGPRLAGAPAAGPVDRRGDGPRDRDPRAVRSGAGQDRHESLVRPAEQHGHELPAAGVGQLRVVPAGLPGPADDAGGEDVLHLHREEPPGAATPRLHLPVEVHPRGCPRRVGVVGPGRVVAGPGSGGEGDASGGRRMWPAAGIAGSPGESEAGAIEPGAADRTAHGGVPEPACSRWASTSGDERSWNAATPAWPSRRACSRARRAGRPS